MNENDKKGLGPNEENEDVEDQNSQEESGNDNNDKGDKGTDKGGKGKGGRSFTQDEVSRMMTREKQQGRNAILNELGIKPGDQKQLDALKAYIKSQKSEEQLALEKDQASQTAIAEANERAMIAEAKAEAMMLGVKSQFVEDAVTLALSKVNTDGTGDKADIKTALGELKTKYPIWFEESSDDEDDKGAAGKKTGQKGTGSSVKSNKGGDKGAAGEKSMGARLAAQRKSSTPKKSFWS